jgi:hypothetical protein
MQSYIEQIKNLVSCPPKIYCLLYLATLKQRLQTTVIALKIRLGLLLPKNAGAEVISAEEAQWTYAIFSACLLKGLDYALIKKIIPIIAIDWLQKNIYLFNQWQSILQDNPDDNNDLNQIIHRAQNT